MLFVSDSIPVIRMPLQIVATIQGHPWDLWGLATLFDGSGPAKTMVKAEKPKGRPTFDPNNAEEPNRFRIHGYNVLATLTSDELKWDEAVGRVDLRDVRPIADEIIARLNGLARIFDPSFIPVKLIYLSFSTENGAGSMLNGDWTANKDSTVLAMEGLHVIANSFLSVAQSNPDAKFVLDAMVLPTTWTSLYLVLETITANVDGGTNLKRHGWITEDELSDLGNSANNSRNIHEGARHGKRPNLGRPLIPLDHALSITMKLTYQWLLWLSEQKIHSNERETT
jgi:hypothetical protein